MAAAARRPVRPKLKDPGLEMDAPDASVSDAPDELESETGLDLSEAGSLDVDHVLDDEESSRIQQAPD